MTLINVQSHPQFIFAHKPSGISTHSPGEKKIGFVEYLSEALGESLYVCHRLDKETSGAIVFGRSSEAAALLAAEFEERRVKKEYLFLTKGKASKSFYEIHSFIEKRGNKFFSSQSTSSNASTQLELVRKEGEFSLWKAIPLTGKPHQIRLHARDVGIPILGDAEYGGAPFARVALHAEKITFSIGSEHFVHESPVPEYFKRISLCSNESLVHWLEGVDKRAKIFSPAKTECLRLLHTDDELLRADKFGDVVWYYWYGDNFSDEDKESITLFSSYLSVREWHLSVMKNRGDAQNEHTLISSKDAPSSWTAEENGVRFLLSAERGRSPGLFLDQRKNRALIKDISTNKRVLNLFCYTGGFSVCAALGGAQKVVSVDTSGQALSWAKENFYLNNLSLEPHLFIKDDARKYLQRARKKGEVFDVVICDPPSFARSKEGVFSLAKELEPLLELLLAVTAEKGRVLFCTNYEGISKEELFERVKRAARKEKGKTIEQLTPELDVGYPGTSALMKSIMIRK